jgi:Alpha/beta hydrolase family
VHGAWGDASHWRHVIPPLHEKGYRVFAVQNPLTSLADDIARTIKMAAAQDAPTLLVGHAYGCAVITGAGSRQMLSASSIWQDLLSMKERVSRASGRDEHHLKGRLISVKTNMGFYGSKSRSFTRLSVTISKTE